MPESLGHFGLAAKYYCHFTTDQTLSDLQIHRIAKKENLSVVLLKKEQSTTIKILAEVSEQSLKKRTT